MQGAQLAFWGYLGGAALWAVRRGRLPARRVTGVALALLVASMGTTITLTVLDQKDLLRTLLPLHLCSLSALMTLPLLATGGAAFLHFSWYLGMPGAVLALVFPAVEPSSWPALMYTSFMLTHALVAFAPLLMMVQGQLPTLRSAGNVLLVGNFFLVVVYMVDRLIDANYMFLRWAPAGTPLAFMEQLGRVGYLACIELGAVLAVLLMRGCLRLWRGDWRPARSASLPKVTSK